MIAIPESVDFLLSSPITRHNAGEVEDVLILTMVCPTKAQVRKSYKLQQLFTAALTSGATGQTIDTAEAVDAAPTTHEPMSGESVMGILLRSDVDIEEVMRQFERLALSGCVTVCDKPINVSQWSKIDEHDAERMAAEFIGNFILFLVARGLGRI